MKKPILYRAASWIAENYLNNIECHLNNLDALEMKDESDLAEIACYKALQDYFENMEFLKSVKF